MTVSIHFLGLYAYLLLGRDPSERLFRPWWRSLVRCVTGCVWTLAFQLCIQSPHRCVETSEHEGASERLGLADGQSSLKKNQQLF